MVRILSVVLVVTLFATAAQAALIPGGDFEAGGPPGMVKIGNTDVVASVGTGPAVFPGGGLVFLASSTGGTSPLAAGTGPASFFTGNLAGTGGVTQYSGVMIPLTVSAPSLVSLMLNVFTGEVSGGVSDIIAIYIDDGFGPDLVAGWVVDYSGVLTSPFLNLLGSGFDGFSITDAVKGTFVDGQTGWFTIGGDLNPGSYSIYILVGDVVDTDVDTGFGIDNIDLTVVPEPGTWLLFGMGALGMAGARRFRRKPKTAA